MGFSIPISKAKEIIDELMANGYVQGRTRIGITGNDVDAYTAAYQSIPQGFMIQSIDENESAFTGASIQSSTSSYLPYSAQEPFSCAEILFPINRLCRLTDRPS